MSAASVLLGWCQRRTEGYEGVEVADLQEESWGDGMALAAILHDQGAITVWEYAELDAANGEENVTFVLDVLESLGLTGMARMSWRDRLAEVYLFFKERGGERKDSVTGREEDVREKKKPAPLPAKPVKKAPPPSVSVPAKKPPLVVVAEESEPDEVEAPRQLLSGPSKPKGATRRPPSRKKITAEELAAQAEAEEREAEKIFSAPTAKALPSPARRSGAAPGEEKQLPKVPQKKLVPRAGGSVVGAGGTHGVKLEDLKLKPLKKAPPKVAAVAPPKAVPVLAKKKKNKQIRVQYNDEDPLLVSVGEAENDAAIEAALAEAGVSTSGAEVFFLSLDGVRSEMSEGWRVGHKLCVIGEEERERKEADLPRNRPGGGGEKKKRVAEVPVEGHSEVARVLLTQDDSASSLLAKVLRKVRIADNTPAFFPGFLAYESVWKAADLTAVLAPAQLPASALSLYSGVRYDVNLSFPDDSASSVLGELIQLDNQQASGAGAGAVLYLLIRSHCESDMVLDGSESVLCAAAWLQEHVVHLAFGPAPVVVVPLDDPF